MKMYINGRYEFFDDINGRLSLILKTGEAIKVGKNGNH